MPWDDEGIVPYDACWVDYKNHDLKQLDKREFENCFTTILMPFYRLGVLFGFLTLNGEVDGAEAV